MDKIAAKLGVTEPKNERKKGFSAISIRRRKESKPATRG